MHMTELGDRYKWLWFGIRVLIVAVILAVIAARIDFREMAAAVGGATRGPILLAVLLFMVNRVITAAKWDLLLRRNGIRAGLLKLIRIMFESSFLGIAIPSGLGVDIARLVQIRMERHNLTSSASSILADRILAVLTLALLSVVAACFCRDLINDSAVLVTVIVVGLLAVAAILLLMSSLSLKAYSLVRGFLPGAINSKVAEIHESLAGLLKDPSVLAAVLAMNVMVQCVRIAQVHLLFIAVGESVPLAIEIAFVPMILLIKLLPISPYMGIGVQEGAFVYFFSQVGVASEISVSASILMHLVVIIGIMPGAVLFFAGRQSRSPNP